MSKHTPGPWEPCILDRPLDSIPKYVAECITASGGSDFFFVLGEKKDGPADICHVGNGPSSSANAHLISAAPELLEVARMAAQAYSVCRDWSMDEVEIDGEMVDLMWLQEQAEAAIAKATGEEV